MAKVNTLRTIHIQIPVTRLSCTCRDCKQCLRCIGSQSGISPHSQVNQQANSLASCVNEAPTTFSISFYFSRDAFIIQTQSSASVRTGTSEVWPLLRLQPQNVAAAVYIAGTLSCYMYLYIYKFPNMISFLPRVSYKSFAAV